MFYHARNRRDRSSLQPDPGAIEPEDPSGRAVLRLSIRKEERGLLFFSVRGETPLLLSNGSGSPESDGIADVGHFAFAQAQMLIPTIVLL
jgi:hypothetical protein